MEGYGIHKYSFKSHCEPIGDWSVRVLLFAPAIKYRYFCNLFQIRDKRLDGSFASINAAAAGDVCCSISLRQRRFSRGVGRGGSKTSCCSARVCDCGFGCDARGKPLEGLSSK